MQDDRVIQNTSDIQPVKSRQFFGTQMTNRTSTHSSSRRPTDERKQEDNVFEDSFLAQVEERRHDRKEGDVDIEDSPAQYSIEHPREINLGIIQANKHSGDSERKKQDVNDTKIENKINANVNINGNIDNNVVQTEGYRESFHFSRERKNQFNDSSFESQPKTSINNVEIGSIQYGTYSDVEQEQTGDGLLVEKGNNNIVQLSDVTENNEGIDKKIGDFLNHDSNQTREDVPIEKVDRQADVRKKRSFLPSIITNTSLSLSPFTTGVLAVSLAIMAVGFVSFGIQAKGDIEVKGARAVNYIKEAKIDLQNKNFESATTNLVSAKQEFKSAQDQINKLGGRSLDVFAHIPILSKISSGKNVVVLGDGLTDAVVQLSNVSELLAGVGNPLDLENENRSSLTDIFVKVRESINLSKESLRKAEVASAKIKISDLPEEYQEKIRFIKDFLPLVNDSLDEFDRAAEIFLELFGHNGPRKYLIVFQNNQEMRATGGFIGSYGLLETSQGKIDKLKIEGIYNPDGQLTVDVVPPRPIQKISASWSTHDANWWPDFSKSAEKISWFYEKTGGPTVDGVIAVTPVLLQKMLEVTGPIEMTEYNKTITSKNVIKEIQQEVEVDYKKDDNKNEEIVEATTEKIVKKSDNDPKKILADLTPILFAKFFDLNNPRQAGEVIKILLDTLKEKHILINFEDSKIQGVVATQGWAGEILKTEKDYLMVVNSNINGYKTDGVVDEEIKHQAEIKSDGSIVDTVTITRKHNGGKTKYEWWNQVNADYMRVYVPKGSQLISAEGHTREMNDERLNYEKLGFKVDVDVKAEENYMEIDEDSGTRIYEEGDKTVFANWVYVSPQERVTVVYKYLLPFKVDLTSGENNRYSLLMQKQSGSTNSVIKSAIEYPFAWKTTWVEPKNLKLDKRNGKLLFSHELDIDQFIGVVFK